MLKKVKIHCTQLAMVMISRYLVFLFLFIILRLSAQETDNQLRFTPSLSYKMTKKWKLSFDYRLAFKNDISTFKSSMFQPSLEYKIRKGLTAELSYRFSTAFSHDSHRFMASVQYRHKIEDFTLISRTRYQLSIRSLDPDFMGNYKDPSQYIRQKVTLDYNIPKSKISLYAAPELFLSPDSNPLSLHRIRYHIGADYNLKYGNNIGISLFYEDVFKVTKDDRFVYNIKYSLSIDELIKKIRKKRKKRKKAKAEKEKKDEMTR